jgi:hypothetical protein
LMPLDQEIRPPMREFQIKGERVRVVTSTKRDRMRTLIGLGALAPLVLVAMLGPVPAPCCASDSPSEAVFSAIDCCSESTQACEWTAAGPADNARAISTPARLAVAAATDTWPPHDRLVPIPAISPAGSGSPPPPLLRSSSVLRI